jgi:hypothetical protein
MRYLNNYMNYNNNHVRCNARYIRYNNHYDNHRKTGNNKVQSCSIVLKHITYIQRALQL